MASTLFRRPVTRWAVPGVVTAMVVGTGIAVPVLASTDDELPERSAFEVIASLDGAGEVPFAGTVVQTAELGLPPLPSGLLGDGRSEAGPGATITELLTGSNTARIWYGGPEQVRVALQDETEQSDLIVEGDDLWLWNSTENAALHSTRDALEDSGAKPHPPTATPSTMATFALGALAEGSDVSVDGTAQVAGRAAYELVVEPTDEESLIGSIRLAIDGEHGVPLRAQVFDSDAGAGDDPAVEVGFTSVTFEQPDDSVFEFTPPTGATVEELDPEAFEDKQQHDPEKLAQHTPSIVGAGWTSVLVLHGIDLDEMAAAAVQDGADDQDVAEGSAAVDAFLGSLPRVEGDFGSGVVFESDLVSALLLDDGRLLVGAVTPDALQEVAASPEAAADLGDQ